MSGLGLARRAAAAGALVALAAALGACGGDGGGGAGAVTLRPSDSSWVPGQRSLSEVGAYRELAKRAGELAGAREKQRAGELAAIELAKRAAKKAEEEERRRRLEELRRRALARYRAALRAAEEAKRKQLAEIERQKREAAERLKELLKQLEVEPGSECKIPEVAREFVCRKGRLPFSKTKK